MAKNELIEIGSRVNIILSFISETTINGETYAAGEPYLYLKEVIASVRYKDFKKSGSSVTNRIAHDIIAPESIIISDIDFSKKLASLIIAYQDKNVSIPKTIFNTYTNDESNIIYLNDTPTDINKIYVYDQNLNKVAAIVYNEASNSITSENFIPETQYLISFTSEMITMKYSLNQVCSIPYMSMEIQGIGNIDKQTKEVIMYFEKVSLRSLINFNFFPDAKINLPLEFLIIDGENYIGFEE